MQAQGPKGGATEAGDQEKGSGGCQKQKRHRRTEGHRARQAQAQLELDRIFQQMALQRMWGLCQETKPHQRLQEYRGSQRRELGSPHASTSSSATGRRRGRHHRMFGLWVLHSITKPGIGETLPRPLHERYAHQKAAKSTTPGDPTHQAYPFW